MFNQKLTSILESQTQTLYKGVPIWGGYERWIENPNGMIVPGFLATYEIARIYAQPTLTGDPEDPSLIGGVQVERSEVEDLTKEFRQWVDENTKKGKKPKYDVSLHFPPEWRDRIWTVMDGGSAHRTGLACWGFCEFVFCGKPKPYKIIKHYKSEQEWKADR